MRKADNIDEIPEYLREITDTQILNAKKLQNANTFSFLFYTDSHITDVSSFADLLTINYINHNMELEFTACCGDNLDNNFAKTQHLETASRLINTLTFDNFFTVKGNHDDNSFMSEGTDNIKYTMLPREQYEIMFHKMAGIVNFDTSNKYGLYYYYDIPQYKVRAVFLNSIDIPYLPDPAMPAAWKYAGQSTYAYSNAQLNWLAHSALNLPDTAWKVILFTHINPFNEDMIGADNLAHNSLELTAIVDAFKKGTSYNSVSTDGDFAQAVSVDFTDRGKGNVLAFFYGHTHSEQVLNRNGIPYISTWNDCPKKSLSNPGAPARTAGTTSEICLNIVTVDLEQSKIFMTKIGAGDDLEISVI